MIRKTSVAGSFYPASKDEIEAAFVYFNDIISQQFTSSLFDLKPKALIVPHAGYVYSGFTANLAYRNVNYQPKRVVVIGPSHRVAFNGASLVGFDAYETPFGDIKADNEFISLLQSKFSFEEFPMAHNEHSTEVQFPFVKYYFPKAQLVEIVYGQAPNLEEAIEVILKEEDTLLLLSTDLSHFYTQDEANALDEKCIEAIESQDDSLFLQSEACGMLGLKALLSAVKRLHLHTKSIDYRTSGDITGDTNRVVGYYSAMVY